MCKNYGKKLWLIILVTLYVLKVHPTTAQHTNDQKAEFGDKKFYLIDSLDLSSVPEYDRNVIDSFMKLYHQPGHDTTKLNYIDQMIDNIGTLDLLSKYSNFLKSHSQKKIEKGNLSTEVFRFYKIMHAIGLNNLATIHVMHGRYEIALKDFEDCLAIMIEVGDKQKEAIALGNIGLVYEYEGEMDKALEYLLKGLKIEEEIGDKNGIAISLNNIGIFIKDQGDIPTALEYLEKSLKIREEIGNKKQISVVLNNIGDIYENLGRIPEALDYLNRSLEIDIEIGNRNGESTTLNNIGILYKHQGNIPKALDYLHRSLKIDEEMGAKRGMASTLNNLGNIYSDLGDLELAMENHQRSLKIAREIGYKRGEAIYLCNIAGIYLDLEEIDKALEYYQKGYSIDEELGSRTGMATTLNNIGLTYSKLGNSEKAFEYYHRGLKIAREVGTKHYIATVLNNLGELYFDQNQIGMAKKYALECMKFARESESVLEIKSAAWLLVQIYKAQGNYKGAFEMYQLEIVMRDSVLNESNQKEVLKKEMKYRMDKKEQEIIVANQKQELQGAKLDRAEQRALFLTLIAVLFLLIILITGFFIYRLNKIKQALIRINQTKDKFFAIIGHDLRSSANVFQGLGAMIKSYVAKKKTAQIEELSDDIEEASTRLNSLLDNLLNWAFTQLETVPYHPANVEVNKVVREVIETSSGLAESKGISLKESGGKTAVAYVDNNALNLVLRNLLHNAIKFTGTGGTIEINTVRQDHQLEISVSDNGIGIERERLDKLFELSQSDSRSGTQQEKGSGLGLTLCREFVSLNNGKIWAESEIGKGTKMVFTLPLAA